MKNLVLVCVFLICGSSFAQCFNCYDVLSVEQYKNAINLETINFTNQNFDALRREYVNNAGAEIPNVDGSVFLFESWNNKAIIQTGKSTFSVPNINYNIDKKLFMTKLDDGSVMVYDFNKIESILINNKIYSKIEGIGNDDQIFEVLHRDKNLTFAKTYDIKVIEAAADPKLNRLRPKIKQKATYYAYTNGDLNKVKLRKKELIALVNNKEKLQEYVARYKPSFNDEIDFTRALAYSHK